MTLGFGGSTFRYAAKPGTCASVEEIAGHRVATSYSGLVEKHLADQGVSAQVVRLDGAVETAITLGVADVIADVVETGTTLRQQGLEVFGEEILRSEAVLIRREGSHETAAVEVLRRRLTGVITARHYVMLDYDVPGRPGRGGLRDHPGPGVADRVAAAEQGLGRRPGDGAAVAHQRDHGRALGPRGAGDPRHRHRRVPVVSRLRRPRPDRRGQGLRRVPAPARAGRRPRLRRRDAAAVRRHRRPAARAGAGRHLAHGRQDLLRRGRGGDRLPALAVRLDPGDPDARDGSTVRNLFTTRVRAAGAASSTSGSVAATRG